MSSAGAGPYPGVRKPGLTWVRPFTGRLTKVNMQIAWPSLPTLMMTIIAGRLLLRAAVQAGAGSRARLPIPGCSAGRCPARFPPVLVPAGVLAGGGPG